MTKRELIDRLKNMDDDKVIIISDGKGWTNIGEVLETQNIVIFHDNKPIFEGE